MSGSEEGDRSPRGGDAAVVGALARGGRVAAVGDRALLGEILGQLNVRRYRVAAFDCRRWTGPAVMVAELAEAFEVPDYYPRTLAAVLDHLTDLARSDTPMGEERLRLAVVLGVFDSFLAEHRASALSLVDGLAQASRMAEMFGHRLLPVVQTDGAGLDVAAAPTVTIGTFREFRDAMWPPRPRPSA